MANSGVFPYVLSRLSPWRYFISLKLRAVHTNGESGNWFPLRYRYVCFSPTFRAVQKAVRRKVELAVGPAARVVGETTTGRAAGASSGGGAGGMAKATRGAESGTGGLLVGQG